MSIFDIRSIIDLSHPLPNKVWAAICAIVLLGIVWRSLARAPETLRRHTSKVWLAVLALPVLLIGLLFALPDTGGGKDEEVAKIRGKKPLGEPDRASERADVKADDPAPIRVVRNAECAAAKHDQDGEVVVIAPEGTRKIVVRRSAVQPDPLRRVEAITIAEERAKAALVSYARSHTRQERVTDTGPGRSKLEEMIRSVAEGDLSGVRRVQSCYEDGMAWVKLEMTAP
jgi:hypothetical protein